MNTIRDWIPLLQKLIWPLFIVILLFAFSKQLNELYRMATEEGRSVEIAGWFKIGERVQNTEINSFASKDLSLEAVEGDEIMVEKGSAHKLQQLQEKLRTKEIKSIDILKITSEKAYYRKLLLKYVSSLGIKHIVFVRDGRYDGWMTASIFSGQLLTGTREVFEYDDLRAFLAGIKTLSVEPAANTLDVLRLMEDSDEDNIAVVENEQFHYIINKQDILTTLVSGAILAGKEQKTEEK